MNGASEPIKSSNTNLIRCYQGENNDHEDNSLTLNGETEVIAYRGINLGRNSLTYAMESRIHLPSLEDELGQPFNTFPSPHLSTPVLPPIKKQNINNTGSENERFATLKRPRPTASLKRMGSVPSQIPTAVDLKAIRYLLNLYMQILIKYE